MSEWKETALLTGGLMGLCALFANVPGFGNLVIAGLALAGIAYLSSKWKSGDL